ncbi:MAG TPA: tetratricopeptide repeat protein [Petrimonas sp.]|nr:tetratricopeptide repeat protein [Petrimonas sp.]
MKRLLLLVIAAFFASVATYAQDAAALINNANEALKNKQYAQAFELYEKAMSNLGEVQVDSAINFNIGFAALQANKLDAAIKYFDKAIDAGTNVAKCYEFKANTYSKMKDFAKALENFEKAIEIAAADDVPGLAYNAAVTAYQGNNPEKAVLYFDKAIQGDFKATDAIYYKAVVLNKMGKDAEYKQTLVEGAEKFPTEKKITAALANVYVSEGNEFYKKGVEIINAANEKVTQGTLKTDDAAYTAEVDKSKVEFRKAVEVLGNAIKLDATNQNAVKLMDACKKIL